MKLSKITAISFGVITLAALPFAFLEAVKDEDGKGFEKLRMDKGINSQGASEAGISEFERITHVSKGEYGNIKFKEMNTGQSAVYSPEKKELKGSYKLVVDFMPTIIGQLGPDKSSDITAHIELAEPLSQEEREDLKVKGFRVSPDGKRVSAEGRDGIELLRYLKDKHLSQTAHMTLGGVREEDVNKAIFGGYEPNGKIIEATGSLTRYQINDRVRDVYDSGRMVQYNLITGIFRDLDPAKGWMRSNDPKYVASAVDSLIQRESPAKVRIEGSTINPMFMGFFKEKGLDYSLTDQGTTVVKDIPLDVALELLRDPRDSSYTDIEKGAREGGEGDPVGRVTDFSVVYFDTLSGNDMRFIRDKWYAPVVWWGARPPAPVPPAPTADS